jgi:hypothetical protein
MSRLGNALTRFIDNRRAPQLPELPSVHVTDGYTFRKILETKKLVPTPCRVFKTERLLYFFYGKPSYRSSVTKQIKPNDAELSVAFFLKLGSLASLKVKRVFSFDSGAYQRGRFDRFVKIARQRIGIKEFQMRSNTHEILKQIESFFGTNEKYFERQPKLEIDGINRESLDYFELTALHGLIQASSTAAFDDRLFVQEAALSCVALNRHRACRLSF